MSVLEAGLNCFSFKRAYETPVCSATLFFKFCDREKKNLLTATRKLPRRLSISDLELITP